MKTVKTSGILATTLGLVVIFSWYMQNDPILRVLPGYVAMQFNTALSFVLCGIALIAIGFRKEVIGALFGGISGLIGLLTLTQYMFSFDLGIDQLLFEPHITDKTSTPGRMAPNTALSFTLSGLAFIINLLAKEILYKNYIIRITGTLVFALGFISIIGYLINIEEFYTWSDLPRMAIHTSIGFIIVGIGIFSYAQELRKISWASSFPHWISIFSAISFFILAIFVQESVSAYESDQIRKKLQTDSTLIQEYFIHSMDSKFVALARMVDRWKYRDLNSEDEWKHDALNYVNDFLELDTISIIDKDLSDSIVAKKNDVIRDANIDKTSQENLKENTEESKNNDEIKISIKEDASLSQKKLVVVFPITTEKKYRGYLVSEFILDNLVDTLLPSSLTNLYGISIHINGSHIITKDALNEMYIKKWGFKKNFDMYGAEWEITIWPKTDMLSYGKSNLPEITLIIGAVVSILIGIAIYFATASRKMNEALKDSAEQHRAVLDNTVDGLITINQYGMIERFNPACEKIFGYKAEEVVGKNIKLLMPEPYHGEHDGYLKNYNNTGIKKIIGIGREVQGKHKNGTAFPIDLSVSEVFVQNKKIFSGIVRDITERKKVEQDIKDYASRLQAVMDTVVDGVITINDRGIIQSFNPSAERIFGYQSDEVIGKNVKMLMPEPYHNQHDSYIKNYLFTGNAKVIGVGREVEAKRKDGSTFSMELGINEMIVGNKKMFAGTIRDISERKSAEKEKEELIKKLSESNEELEKFAYIASHDLQEPLRMVSNFTSLLEKKYNNQLDDDAKKYIQISRDSALRMQALVQDLLEYARTNEEIENYQEVNCERALKYIQENLSVKINETNATILYENLPVILCHPVRFSSVIQNLISNSLKYQTKDSSPIIKISAVEDSDNWKFCIEDNGIGMKQEYCEQIFLPFKRLHRKEEYSGTGIGLAICKKIIEKMGGRIWAESELGNGSKFYFTIPKKIPTKNNIKMENAA